MSNKNINKVVTESFKNILDVIGKEAEQKVTEMGYDPSTIEGKALIFSFRKKVLDKLGIDLSLYNSDEFLTLWEENKDEIMKEIRTELDGFSENVKNLGSKVNAIEKKKIDWQMIENRPENVSDLGHTDKEHPKILASIQNIFSTVQTLARNITSIRQGMMASIEEKIKGLKIWHKDLQGVGPDDHHKEKHNLESHIDSPLMTQLLAFIKNPTGGRVMRGGGATAFTQLVDAPISFAGQAGKAVYVKATADGLEFKTAVSTDEKVKLNALDATAGYLDDKIAGYMFAKDKQTIANKSSSYPVVVGDTGKVLVDTNGITFTLPVITSGDIGTKVTIVKNNTGTTTITANTGQYIADSTSAGSIYNDVAGETWATITLVAISTTQWVILGQDGTWTAI